MHDPDRPQCPSCAYHAAANASAHALYHDQLLRADRLQQELSAARAELRSVKRELSAAREERDIAERRAARTLAREAA